jgi:hypothetical protein
LPEPQRFGRAPLEHEALHAPLLQDKVPLEGGEGHVTHALLQSIWPPGQPQTPSVQLAPMGQARPQPPQLFASV